MKAVIERRTLSHEIRAAGKGTTKISGYGALFNSLSEDLGGFREIIHPGAFDSALKTSDICALFDHDSSKILGRQSSGTLKVSVDDKGLYYEITPPDTSYARDLAVSIKRGDIAQSSFAFTIEEDDWEETPEGMIRHIRKVKELYDVCPVTYPAYPDTDVALRSLKKQTSKPGKSPHNPKIPTMENNTVHPRELQPGLVELSEELAEVTTNAEAEGRSIHDGTLKRSEQRQVTSLIEDIRGLVRGTDNHEEHYRRMNLPEGQRPVKTPTYFAGLARSLFDGKTNSITEKNAGEFIEIDKRTLFSTGAANAMQNPFLASASDVIFDPIINSTLAALGFDIFDLPSNFYKLPKVAVGDIGAYYNEGDAIPTGEPTINAVKFDVKNWGLLIKVHNNVLRDGGPRADAIIQGTFVRALELMFLRSALFGDVANKGFAGLDNIAGVQTLSAGNAILSNYDLLTQAGEMVMEKNGDPSKISGVMSQKVWRQLQNAKDTTGQQLMKPNGMSEWPLRVSTAVKTDYGAGNDETRVYLGDFSTVKLGIEGRYEMRLDQTFAADDMTGFAMVVRADMQLFQPDHIVRIEDIANA